MIIDELTAFVIRERDRFENDQNNVFAFSFSEITRYYEFITIILGRYNEVSKSFMENIHTQQKMMTPGTHKITEEEWKLHEEGRRLTSIVHLEIESYYQFAKILLDKIAHSIEFYFGQVRGEPFDSHDDLTKNFTPYITAKGLSASNELLEIVPKLKKDISDYRDYKIAHEKSPRVMKGTIFQADGKVRMSITKLYPNEKDIKELEKDIETRFIPDLQVDIDRYVRLVISFIEENREKTRLKTTT